MKVQNELGDKIATVFRVLGISQYSLLRQQTYLATHPCYGSCVVKFAFTLTTKQQLNTEAVFLHNHNELCWPKYIDYGSTMGMDWLIIEFFDTLCVSMRNFNIVERQKVTKSAEQALHTLHRKGYIHGDIKPSNLIVTLYHEVRLIDLGSIVPIESDYKFCTPSSLTPKFCALNPYLRVGYASPQHDFFSLAVSLQTMWKAHPFGDLSLLDFAKTNGKPEIDDLFSRYQILISKQIKHAKLSTYPHL
ncbi:protein kinase domain-containing protein [Vibrio tetraodonis]|uniref:protein kinase domain-containing protein n=1 Tax=Vibrio tetraodonis TaxID=2231647 RepID=UPI000E0AA253|nr:protein kinase family protein [Vibrio tetraodonis]